MGRTNTTFNVMSSEMELAENIVLFGRSLLKEEAWRFSGNSAPPPFLKEPCKVFLRRFGHAKFAKNLRGCLFNKKKLFSMRPLSARSISMDSTFKCTSLSLSLLHCSSREELSSKYTMETRIRKLDHILPRSLSPLLSRAGALASTRKKKQ